MIVSSLILALLTGVAFADDCYEKLRWSTDNGRVIVNGQPLVIKGINYYGFQSSAFAPDGLDERNLKDILDFIKDNDFNAIRVPFSLELVRDNPYASKIDCVKNLGLCNATGIRLLDVFIHRAAERGLLVVLSNDQFSALVGEVIPTQFTSWYNAQYTEDLVIRIWNALISRYRNQWNVFAVDLKNEPDHYTKWRDSNRTTDWNKAAERMINGMSRFNGFFLVTGVNWGANLEEVREYPIDTGNASLNNRVVYAPHSYGPSIYYRTTFKDPNFPEVMDNIYMHEYGFLPKAGKAVVIGQWGARISPGTSGDKWNKWYVQWMRTNCLTNNFYWSITPRSSIIGGLFEDDWETPIQYKIDLLKRAQPNPTKFEARDGQICITKGVFPEKHCQV